MLRTRVCLHSQQWVRWWMLQQNYIQGNETVRWGRSVVACCIFKAEVKNFSVVGSSLRFLRRRDCVTGSEAGVAETHRKWSEASLCSAWFINNTMSTIYTSSTFRFQFCKFLNWDILTIFVIVFLVFFLSKGAISVCFHVFKWEHLLLSLKKSFSKNW